MRYFAHTAELQDGKPDPDLTRKVRCIIGVTQSLGLRYSASSAGNCRCQDETLINPQNLITLPTRGDPAISSSRPAPPCLECEINDSM